MPAFDPLDHPIHSIPEILAAQLASAERCGKGDDPNDLDLAAKHFEVVRHIREVMANREQYDRDHDAKQTRECEPL